MAANRCSRTSHRLSTITHADQIIVAERGTHQELLALNGRYASMWEEHCRAERAVSSDLGVSIVRTLSVYVCVC